MPKTSDNTERPDLIELGARALFTSDPERRSWPSWKCMSQEERAKWEREAEVLVDEVLERLSGVSA